MSRSSTTTNRHDVAVARYKMFSKLAVTLMPVLITAIAAAGTTPSTIDLDNTTVVITPGGSMTVTPVPASANANALPPFRRFTLVSGLGGQRDDLDGDLAGRR